MRDGCSGDLKSFFKISSLKVLSATLPLDFRDSQPQLGGRLCQEQRSVAHSGPGLDFQFRQAL